jgi:DNA helicase-2/ATP-dependent DNA helicase PcrA
MDVTDLIDGLNDRQREAVSAPLQNMLILAGAGSGKTRVLVHRIAWLMRIEKVSAFGILAVTFTNKAAAEMRGRVERITGSIANGMWIGTFHGLAHRFLRMHYNEAKLPQSFQILDSDDQLRMVKRLCKSLQLDEKAWPAKQFQWYINGKKDEGLRPAHIQAFDPNEQTMLQVYKAYQEACDRSGLVDFAEILLRAHEVLLNHPTVLAHYQQRFSNILVDEFQDTNAIQYAWLRLLTGNRSHMMAVGDDDQSIYGWRGAKVENLHSFLKDLPDAKTIRLEQNYRSSGTILKAANALILNNSGRMGKDLWTDGEDGEPISVYTAFNELDEARFIAGKIKDWLAHGNSLNDTAILYRSNAQSRVLEEALLQQNLPYRIYGGLRFFDRQEIKDTLAYMRLISNITDDAAFERVINTPTRGIGNRTLQLVRDAARDHGYTLSEAAHYLVQSKDLSGRAANAVNSFFALLDTLGENTRDKVLHEQADLIMQQSGLRAMYQAEKGEKGKTRLENMDELVTACRQYEPLEEDENMSELDAFLAHAALEAGESQADEFDDAVQLMTLHSAKGLEFSLVFMAGVEEGMFPSVQSNEDITRLEEERRLCYVGITRAKDKLYICHAENRRIYGQEKTHRPSRFLKELPDSCIEEIRLSTKVTRPKGRFSATASHEAFESTGFNLGQRVSHPKFGEGTILNYEGSGVNSIVQVAFDDVGTKMLMTELAPLTAV